MIREQIRSSRGEVCPSTGRKLIAVVRKVAPLTVSARTRALVLLCCLVALPMVAQRSPINARGFDPEKAYQTGDVDHVNLFNGNLIETIPIGSPFVVSDHLSYSLQLVYNGQPFDFRLDGEFPKAVPSRFANAGLGWQVSLGALIPPNDVYSAHLGRAGNWVWGSSGNPIVGYTRDASYVRLRRARQILNHVGAARARSAPLYTEISANAMIRRTPDLKESPNA